MKLKDITGQKFGDWEVVSKAPRDKSGHTMWNCICTRCGRESVVSGASLQRGASLSCGCSRKKNIIGHTFGRLTVIRSLGGRDYECKCSCGNIVNVKGGNLTSGGTLSCGCLKNERRSVNERGLAEYIKEVCSRNNYTVLCNDWSILGDKEIDIYIPEIKLGFEYNGCFWHSDRYKDAQYHINKTSRAREAGIRLVHIYDYEYIKNKTTVYNYIEDLLNEKKTVINARECNISTVSTDEARQFLNNNHLQGFAPADVYVGLTFNDEVVAIMSFGKPRFTESCSTEIIRLAFKSGCIINGGAERLFKYYIDEYKPESIVSYCDISKFSGAVYEKLGFKLDGRTSPNYRWVNTKTFDILSRYQTQKKKLVELGYGTDEQSETEIMTNRGYVRVYDCGNNRYVWGNTIGKLSSLDTELAEEYNIEDIEELSIEEPIKHKARIGDLTGQQFGIWTVVSRAGVDAGKHPMWNCVNDKGEQAVISSYRLIHKQDQIQNIGKQANGLIDLTGQQFGEWTVLSKVHIPNGKQGAVWLCRCSCGKEAQVTGKRLRGGLSKSCGHLKITNKLIDLTGQKFGELKVLGYAGKMRWKCQCSCGKEVIESSNLLRSGQVKSCGCKKEQHRKETLINKYGVDNTMFINTTRESWQIEATRSKEVLASLLVEYARINGERPTRIEMAELLGVTAGRIEGLVREWELHELFKKDSGISYKEDELCEIVDELCNKNDIYAVKKDHSILSGKEIDIYIPDIKTGIEYNGSYWHSELFKEKSYHYDKSESAAKQGIRLIHIFDYEYMNNNDNILNYIADMINKNKVVINARECNVVEISSAEARKFLEANHLQGFVSAETYLGLQYNNEIVAVMSFGTPRFSKECDKELLRLAIKYGTIINGGVEKLFSYYINKYNTASIVSYCDISKFTGRVYKRLGFDCEGISSPNYKWVNTATLDVLSRYQTQKAKLVDIGVGLTEQSESEIMHGKGYYKVYDCGNIKYVWKRK